MYLCNIFYWNMTLWTEQVSTCTLLYAQSHTGISCDTRVPDKIQLLGAVPSGFTTSSCFKCPLTTGKAAITKVTHSECLEFLCEGWVRRNHLTRFIWRQARRSSLRVSCVLHLEEKGNPHREGNKSLCKEVLWIPLQFTTIIKLCVFCSNHISIRLSFLHWIEIWIFSAFFF